MNTKRMSHKQMAARGWTRVDGTKSKLHARWTHTSGWRLQHCGHPTAHWSWMLFDPQGEMVLTGAAGPAKNRAFGTCWPNLATATDYVAGALR